MSSPDDEDEEELLRRAIAMSLEEETGVGFAKSGNRAASLFFTKRFQNMLRIVRRRRC